MLFGWRFLNFCSISLMKCGWLVGGILGGRCLCMLVGFVGEFVCMMVVIIWLSWC